MRIVNCTKEVCTHYCGRRQSYDSARGKPLDWSFFGNRFVMKREADRPLVIQQYATWLLNLAEGDMFIRGHLKDLPDDVVLGCFCAPKDCHCRIIIEASEYYKSLDK